MMSFSEGTNPSVALAFQFKRPISRSAGGIATIVVNIDAPDRNDAAFSALPKQVGDGHRGPDCARADPLASIGGHFVVW
jgi:hypothetical protein